MTFDEYPVAVSTQTSSQSQSKHGSIQWQRVFTANRVVDATTTQTDNDDIQQRQPPHCGDDPDATTTRRLSSIDDTSSATRTTSDSVQHSLCATHPLSWHADCSHSRPTTVDSSRRVKRQLRRSQDPSEIRRENIFCCRPPPPRAWNRLPTELKLMPSTPVFKRSLKTFLF